MTEQWTEIRCIACVSLGWYSSHLLLRVNGVLERSDIRLQLKCPRCKSLIEWTFGKPEFSIVAAGVRNHRRQTAAFE
jgi:phage FluMu protein Com